MSGTATDTAPRVAEGTVERVDLVNRTITVHTDDEALTFDVTPACAVLLNGERIKLRLLQPQDRVSVAYLRRRHGLTALSVEASARP